MINIIGQFFGSSGYSVHSRNLANALSKLTEVRITTGLYPNFERECSDKEIEMLTKKPEHNETNIIIDLPFLWRYFCKGDNNIGFCVWEGDKVPKSFIKEFLNPRIKQIWIPSAHVKQAILNTLDCLSEEQAKEIIEKLK